MVGDFSNWQVNENAIKLTWSEGNVWSKTIKYTDSSTLTFKLVVYSESNPSQITFEGGDNRTVTLSNAQTVNLVWQDAPQQGGNNDNPPAPTINDYVLYGRFDGASNWSEKTINQKDGSNSEWCILSVNLKANDTFKIHMYGETWYGYSDVKSSIDSGLVKQGESDNNIVVIKDGVYDIYSDYNSSDNGHIYITIHEEDEIVGKYCLYGMFNGSTKWTNRAMEKSTAFSDTYTITLQLYENDRFIIHAIGEYWYGYSSLNSQVDRQYVGKASADSNDIVIKKTGKYYISINLGHIEEYNRIAFQPADY